MIAGAYDTYRDEIIALRLSGKEFLEVAEIIIAKYKLSNVPKNLAGTIAVRMKKDVRKTPVRGKLPTKQTSEKIGQLERASSKMEQVERWENHPSYKDWNPDSTVRDSRQVESATWVHEPIKSEREPIKTTGGSAFAKLKTELGLHENIFQLPEPLDDSVKTVKLPIGCNDVLFLSDTQIPFHDISAITCALKYGKENNVNTIFLNGDIVDFYAISTYEKEKHLRDLVTEIEMTREFLSILRQTFPNAYIAYRAGNHEERWQRYIRQNAKEFEGLQELEFAAMFHLDKHDIKYFSRRAIIDIGGLTTLHGHEIRGVGGVFPARTLFMKTMTSAICGDCHRTSEYTAKTITDRFHTCWTVGCLSVLRPHYSPGAQYSHGFAHIRTNDEGDFTVKNFRILDGKII